MITRWVRVMKVHLTTQAEICMTLTSTVPAGWSLTVKTKHQGPRRYAKREPINFSPKETQVTMCLLGLSVFHEVVTCTLISLHFRSLPECMHLFQAYSRIPSVELSIQWPNDYSPNCLDSMDSPTHLQRWLGCQQNELRGDPAWKRFRWKELALNTKKNDAH